MSISKPYCSVYHYLVWILLFPAIHLHAQTANSNLTYPITERLQSDLTYGLSMYTEQQHQKFNSSSADITTLAINPYVLLGNWSLSVDIPWQKISGDYFVNNFQPSTPFICQQLGNLNAAQLNSFLAAKPKFQSAYKLCNTLTTNTTQTDGDVSGISDISSYLSYGKPLDQNNIWYGMLTMGFKWDNGDIENGLGSGTKDILFEASVNAIKGIWISTFSAGYNAILSGEDKDNYENYGYLTTDLAVRAGEIVKLGSQLEWQQAASDFTDDISSIAIYITASPFEKLQLRLMLTDYLDTSGYPEQEIKGSMIFRF